MKPGMNVPTSRWLLIAALACALWGFVFWAVGAL